MLQLDEALQEHNAQLPRLQEFILPAGTAPPRRPHLPHRGRRAERAVVALGAQEPCARRRATTSTACRT